MNREEIINNYDKSNFMTFLQTDTTGKILELLNNEGINILESSPRKEERIAYILTFSKYKNELLQNKDFLEMFLQTDLRTYDAVLNNLEEKTYAILFKTYLSIENNSNSIALFFSYFNEEYKLKVLNNWTYSNDILYELLKIDSTKVINKIINNYPIDLSDDRIHLNTFFSHAKDSVLEANKQKNKNDRIVEEIRIPSTMITKEVAEKIWSNYDIFEVRSIINDIEYCTDPTLLNKYIKHKEEEILEKSTEMELIPQLQEIFNTFYNIKKEEIELEKDFNKDNNMYYEYKRIYRKQIEKLKIKDINYKIDTIYKENGIESVYQYFQELNNRMLSNYIIDYHFEENYHNIIIDIEELLKFYYNGNISLKEEHLELYTKIRNIDYLSNEEKIELHNILKKYNMKEMFYDDMAFARKIVRQAIKDYALTQKELKQYKDEELSKKYGVDVYKIEHETFFGIVKSGGHPQDELPTGHSFSMVGDHCLAVYGDVKKSSTYLYDAEDLNPDQIVHIFPFDSFSFYHPFETSEEASRRVNILMTPDELMRETGYGYNELVILEQGRKNMEMDKAIPKLKRIALYCHDEISKKDVETAKKSGVGILLVNTSNYKQDRGYSSNKYLLNNDHDYFNGTYEKDKFEARR